MTAAGLLPEGTAAVDLVRRFADAFNAAAAGDDLAPLAAASTPTAVAGFLVESHSGTVQPLASRTSVPAGARLDVDADGVEVVASGVLVTRFRGHGFARDDFAGDVELHVRDGQVVRVVFRAP